MMNDPIYFISDAHLGAGSFDVEQEKTRRLLAFLRELRGATPLLYIVGDLFDFWFEYRSVILRQHYRVLYELTRLIEQGTRVVYMSGNHDFWLGSFLREQVGVEAVYGALETEHHGKRLFICHGDGLVAKDQGYRLMRRILHNPVNIWLYQLLHPDLGVALARVVSHLSRNHTLPEGWHPDREYRELALAKLHEGFDGVIFGHSHCPDYQTVDGKVYINLGDWVTHFSYGLLHEGRLSLEWAK
ncbi:MAG: UDP-2,3-diacylglucosamine diphosphatase [Candidatus Latescibacteria bacterium]|nr:UDP-2,3-diacylglucosamine diphosphatase [Candidatus Latescibacterota bacterium]